MIEFLNENWLIIATVIIAVYEVIARKIPTEGNWSIIHLAVEILDLIVKNKAKSHERDEANMPVEKTFKLRKTRR